MQSKIPVYLCICGLGEVGASWDFFGLYFCVSEDILDTLFHNFLFFTQ